MRSVAHQTPHRIFIWESQIRLTHIVEDQTINLIPPSHIIHLHVEMSIESAQQLLSLHFVLHHNA